MRREYPVVWVTIIAIILTVLSYYRIDKPLVWFLVAHHSRDLFILKYLANDVENTIAAFIILFYVYWTLDKKIY